MPKASTYLAESKLPMTYLTGYELTTPSGHLLCYNLDTVIPWEDVSKEKGDLLFDRVHEAGGLIGIAHPFSVHAPIANGTQFSMTLHNYNVIDFIEIINNAHTMIPDNLLGILWWEELLFKGYQIAAITGLDLHEHRDLSHVFKTFLMTSEPITSLELSFTHAITASKTLVTKGPLFYITLIYDTLHIIVDTPLKGDYYAHIKTGTRKWTIPLNQSSQITTMYLAPTQQEYAIIVELYDTLIEPASLMAIAAPIYL